MEKYRHLFYLFIGLLVYWLIGLLSPVYAVDIKDVFSPAKTFLTFGDLVNVVVRNAFTLAGIITFILLIFGGFTVIVGAGSGDGKQLEKGRETLTWAVAGLIVVVTSVWLIQIIEKITGLNLLGL